MLNRRFVLSQLATSKQQSAIFVLCVALSMLSLVALRGLGDSINHTLLADAKELQAADIIVESNFELADKTRAEINALAAEGTVLAAQIREFYTVVRLSDREETLLAEIKAVEPGYPFYGRVELASGRDFADRLSNGVIVEQSLLDRLAVVVGDSLRIGESTMTIVDVVVHESDRPVDFFSLGPRIFVAADDLAATALIQPGSRVTYTTLLKVIDGTPLERVAQRLSDVRDVGMESVETYRTAPSGVQSFFDNLIFFLSLVAIFTLLLAGIGIQSALTAFLPRALYDDRRHQDVGRDPPFCDAALLRDCYAAGAHGHGARRASGFCTAAASTISAWRSSAA